MNNNITPVKRILMVMLVLTLMLVLVFALSRSATNTRSYDSIIPQIGSFPVYVEMEEGVALERSYVPDSDMHISGIEMILVNFEADSSAKMDIAIRDAASDEVIASSSLSMSDLPVGDWFSAYIDINFVAGEEYILSFTPVNCSPYFMQVEGYNLDLSVGFDYITDKEFTYGDIFYYSIPIAVLISAVLIMMILFGYRTCCSWIDKADIIGFFARFGNEAFLLLLFITLSFKIYSDAYVKGVYLTADSDGYLREAVNLVAGRGFSYDGLAGYNSWFANWPIIYPSMIAGMMTITGANAYLASKYVAIFVIAIIEIIFYLVFRKKAWVYSLALTNIGFIRLAYHTWSEVPFILFMLIFGFALSRVVSEDEPKIWLYILLGLSGVATFLTRYFGIYVWFVAGLYWFLMLTDKNKNIKKIISLAISAGISGIISLAYLVMNKLNNGNPTGVSRGTWWDDYHTLTDDLIDSIITEIFNIFSVEVPSLIEELSPNLKVWFILFIMLLVGTTIHKCMSKLGASHDICVRYMNTESVFIIMGLTYYATFIVIRYRSSMDTFYFRFFQPATFMLFVGVVGLILGAYECRNIRWLAGFVSVIVIATLVNVCNSTDWSHMSDYYNITTARWDEAYIGIPAKSVVIWNDLDYRSSWYRPDVVSGDLYELDTMDSLKNRYYGSDYLCISENYIDAIINEGNYDESIIEAIDVALKSKKRYKGYVYIEL